MKNLNLNESVTEIMTTKVVSVSEETPATDIKNLFQESNFHHIPVVDSAGLLTGIISSVDLGKIDELSGVWQMKSNYLNARAIMSNYPFFLSPDDTIASAIELFLQNKFHALPVLDNDTLLGIVTTHDILQLMMKSPELAREDN